MSRPSAQTYTVTVPTESLARAVADRLAERGHRMVAVRVVDHFHFDPSSWWYGKPPMRPEYAGWWDVFSVVLNPPMSDDRQEWVQRLEAKTIRALAREHGGVASGAGGGPPDFVLRTFTRAGLVHDVKARDAERLRRSVLDELGPPAPPSQQPPALGCATFRGGRREVLAVEQAARRIATGEDSVLIDAGDCEDVTEVLGDLFNEALHQDSCYPWTADMVPLFAALAAEDGLTDYHRAWVMVDLYLIATVGRRRLARTADALHAVGKPAIETPDVVAARAAVAAALPVLATRWQHESELGQFMLAGLAAACPESAASLAPAIEDLCGRYAGTSRATTVLLVRGLVLSDATAIETAWEQLESIAPELTDEHDSPYALLEHRALCLLEHLLTTELEGVAP